MRHLLLSDLAHKMGLNVRETIALPCVIERSSLAANMDEAKMLRLALNDKPIRDYLAGICKVAAPHVEV